jgi:hypothetical protein
MFRENLSSSSGCESTIYLQLIYSIIFGNSSKKPHYCPPGKSQIPARKPLPNHIIKKSNTKILKNLRVKINNKTFFQIFIHSEKKSLSKFA